MICLETPFQSLMQAWCQNQDMPPATVRFYLGTRLLQPTECPMACGCSMEGGVLVIEANSAAEHKTEPSAAQQNGAVEALQRPAFEGPPSRGALEAGLDGKAEGINARGAVPGGGATNVQDVAAEMVVAHVLAKVILGGKQVEKMVVFKMKPTTTF